MESWHLEDLIRTVETPDRSTKKRVFYAKSIIEERKLERGVIEKIAKEIFLKKIQSKLETRSFFYQAESLPFSYYLTEEKRIKLYRSTLNAYQSKMNMMTDGLDGYIG